MINTGMDVTTSKSVRNGLIGWAILAAISFLYGGIYTEMMVEGLGFSLQNVLLALFGAILVTLIPGFVLVFAISLIVFYIKNKKK